MENEREKRVVYITACLKICSFSEHFNGKLLISSCQEVGSEETN